MTQCMHQPVKACANKRQAFTLIELLVVISIISLLMAILLPVLGKARNRATEIQCQSNMRGAGLGLQIYLQDFKDILVPPTAPYNWYHPSVPGPSYPANPPWYRVLTHKGYLDGGKPSSILTPSGYMAYPQTPVTANEQKLFRCPSWPHDPATGLTAYALRTGRFGAGHPFQAFPQLAPTNLKPFNHSRFGILFDSISESATTYQYRQYVWLSNFTFKIHLRHSDQAHVVFADFSLRVNDQSTLIGHETYIDQRDTNAQNSYYTPTTIYSQVKVSP